MSLPHLIAAVIVASFAGAGIAQTSSSHSSHQVGQTQSFPMEKLSDSGGYRVSLKPQVEPVPLRKIHSWIFHVEQRDGESFEPSKLVVDGGMPAHGHGFPTEPQITRHLGGGDFLVEGVKFNMAGHWLLEFEVTGPNGTDTASFDLHIGP